MKNSLILQNVKSVKCGQIILRKIINFDNKIREDNIDKNKQSDLFRL